VDPYKTRQNPRLQTQLVCTDTAEYYGPSVCIGFHSCSSTTKVNVTVPSPIQFRLKTRPVFESEGRTAGNIPLKTVNRRQSVNARLCEK
jgi:hypothetical protein